MTPLPPAPPRRLSRALSPGAIVLMYLALALAWIHGTALAVRALYGVEEGPASEVVWAEVVKGTAFVTATSLFLWLLLRRRERVIARLHESEREAAQRYEQLFARSPVAKLLIEAGGRGRILAANEAAGDLYAATPGELCTLSIADLMEVAPEDLEAHFRPRAETQPHLLSRARHLRRDGTAFEGEMRCGPVRIDGRECHIAMVLDVTARGTAERELARVASVMRAIDAASPDGILAHDREGRLIHCNDRMLQFLGMPRAMAEAMRTRPLDQEQVEKLAALSSDPAGLRASLRMALGDSPMPLREEMRLRDGRVLRYACEPIHTSTGVTGRAWYFRDVTDLVTTQHQLTQAVELLEILFDGTPLAIVALDRSYHVTLWNRAAEELFGWKREEVVGGPPPFIPAERRSEFTSYVGRGMAGDVFRVPRTVRHHRDGSPVAVSLIVAPLRGREGEVDGVIGIFEDLSERERAEAKLLDMATRDGLTGLMNRTTFLEQLTLAIEVARARGTRFALHFLDLDNFKVVNDSLGHHVGDKALRHAAALLQAHVRSGDAVGRLGGDEFGLLQAGAPGSEEVVRLADRLVRGLQGSFDVEGHTVYLSCSVGVALYPDDGDTPETLLRHADLAMYAAKDRGRHTWAAYDPELEAVVHERRRLEIALDDALRRDLLALHFQPKIRLATGEPSALEALIRWNHPDFGWVAPAKVIAIAESSGLIGRLGGWVVRRACAAARRLHVTPGFPSLKIAVNISMGQFRDPAFVEELLGLLAQEDASPADFELELTETMLASDPREAIARVAALSDAGFTIAIDDFGTGYSSLAYLTQYRVDRLKADRSFVAHVPDDRRACEVLTASVALAAALGIPLVAEGVERPEQEAFLRSIAVEEVQGFLYTAPLPLPELIAWCRARRRAVGVEEDGPCCDGHGAPAAGAGSPAAAAGAEEEEDLGVDITR